MIFMTGATGYIGRHVLAGLTGAGYSVTALARQLPADHADWPGVRWICGDLSRPHEWQSELGQCEAVVHTAMGYHRHRELSEIDQLAVQTFLSHGKFLIYTGNLFTCPIPEPGTGLVEELFAGETADWRNLNEVELLASDVPVAVIRLGFVHGGQGDHVLEILPRDDAGRLLVDRASESTCPIIQVDDVVSLYLTVMDKRAEGIFHAAPDHGVPVADFIVETARKNGLETAPVASAEALGSLGYTLLVDNCRARDTGWEA